MVDEYLPLILAFLKPILQYVSFYCVVYYGIWIVPVLIKYIIFKDLVFEGKKSFEYIAFKVSIVTLLLFGLPDLGILK